MDITGGAPELHPDFDYLVESAAADLDATSWIVAI